MTNCEIVDLDRGALREKGKPPGSRLPAPGYYRVVSLSVGADASVAVLEVGRYRWSCRPMPA